MNDSKQQKPKTTAIPGLAAMGLIITGIAGIHHAYANVSGVGLIASAISFGCILVVMLR
jgi:hypothetical protein